MKRDVLCERCRDGRRFPVVGVCPPGAATMVRLGPCTECGLSPYDRKRRKAQRFAARHRDSIEIIFERVPLRIVTTPVPCGEDRIMKRELHDKILWELRRAHPAHVPTGILLKAVQCGRKRTMDALEELAADQLVRRYADGWVACPPPKPPVERPTP